MIPLLLDLSVKSLAVLMASLLVVSSFSVFSSVVYVSVLLSMNMKVLLDSKYHIVLGHQALIKSSLISWSLHEKFRNFKKNCQKTSNLKAISHRFHQGVVYIIYCILYTRSMVHSLWSIHLPNTSKNGTINDPISNERVFLHENGFYTLKIR